MYFFPAVIGMIEILLIFLVFNLEPINYCIMRGFDEQGLKHMKRVYRKKSLNLDLKKAETIE